ncbi:MAG TPA: hypothetical protein PKV16_03705 [Caldisericia bacterium]|nr:hypothetical protein [Caldisericia bacterium]HPF48417.1 hypothetical protein [Caldisericia bacterium]HPI83403.1 hypothetical protein [Caldisericia bacterium]HPQ92871.1 hypothetical protein [Caldisericia bacterium]HRV74031.1 hypothetical protein [Caldisericia bacterium]
MGKRFITNWFRLVEYFLYSYTGAMGISLIFLILTDYIDIYFIFMTVLFPGFLLLGTLRYYSTTEHSKRESRRLSLFWLPAQVVFDFVLLVGVIGYTPAQIYIGGLPWIAIGYIFTFFAPWIADGIEKRKRLQRSRVESI